MEKIILKKEELDKKRWEEKGVKCRKDYVRCEKCHKPVSTRAKMAPEFSLWIEECEECENRIEIMREKITGRFLKYIGNPGGFADEMIKNAGKGKRVGPDLYSYVHSYLEKKGI